MSGRDDEQAGLSPTWAEACRKADAEAKPRPQQTEAPPLTLIDWLKRDLPASDLLLPWLSTTSRVLIAANWAACNETMAWILK